MKKQVFIGLLISAVFLYLAFRNVNIPEMVEALEKANYWWLLPGIVMMFISLGIRAYRWQFFLLSIAKVPIKKLFSSMMIGYMANNVLPLRLGEIMRALAIGNSAKISRTSAFATILVERIIDVISLLMILGFTVFFHEFPPNIKNAGLIIFAGSVLLVVFIVLLMEKTDRTIRFVWWLGSPCRAESAKASIKTCANSLAVSRFSGRRSITLPLSFKVSCCGYCMAASSMSPFSPSI